MVLPVRIVNLVYASLIDVKIAILNKIFRILFAAFAWWPVTLRLHIISSRAQTLEKGWRAGFDTVVTIIANTAQCVFRVCYEEWIVTVPEGCLN